MQKYALTKILACVLAMLMLLSTLAISTASANSYISYSENTSSVDETTPDENTSDKNWFDKLPSIPDIKDYFEGLFATKDETSISDYFLGLINTIPTNDEGDRILGDYVFRIGLDSTYIFDVEIISYTGTADELEIPARMYGMAVTSIDSSVFSENLNLTYVKIPYTVKSIGDGAFLNCENLTNVKLARGLKTIDDSAFNGCTNLSEIKIPATVTSIGSSAFSGTALTEVTIPASVEYVADDAFGYCEYMEYITVSSRNKNYYSVDGALVRIGEDGEGDTLVVYPTASLNEEFTVPETVTTMSDSIFNSCANLKTVYMSASNCQDTFSTLFVFCSELETIYFDGTVSEWNEFEMPIFFVNEDQNVTVICNDGTLVVNEAYYYGDEESSDDEASNDEATLDEASKDEATTDEATKDEVSKDEASKDEATKDEFDLGDVNGDGKLNIRDATLIQKYLAKLETLTEAQLKAADYNKDTKVNIKDATAIQKKLAGLI